MKLVLFLAVLIILGLAGGAGALLFWEVPPPTATVEKVLPNDRFPQ